MRILIISLPRTGSTSLLHSIANSKKLKPLFEPFDGTNRVTYEDEMSNIVLKTIVDVQRPENCDDYLNWIIKFSKSFDEIILLSRKDLKACAESHAYSVHNRKNGFTSTDSYLWEPTPVDELCYNNIIKWNSVLNTLSNVFNIPITYYEDLYNPNDIGRLRKGNRDEFGKSII
jgi:hypothetical protein